MAESLSVDTSEVIEQIISEVATRKGTDPIELPPLFEAVDPDALEAIFAPTEQGGKRVGQIQFPYAGYEITVEFENELVVSVTEGTRPSSEQIQAREERRGRNA
ncbi:HalOD1 output domain-containing protein [Natrinema zhouii]|uniref:HalOD1 output domain-containing protein n=1 Tax=Natrinema zhouii TaxID=1710539 RepID=UPI0030F3F755